MPLLGYGHITPETPLGQIVTVLYTFLGVSLTMLTLKTMGKRPRNVKKKSVFVTFALMILTVCLGGLEGMYVKGWTFVEGFYAWFATLSTLGYGDYVPGWSVLLQVEESSNPKSQLNLVLIIFISALSSMQAAWLLVFQTRNKIREKIHFGK